MPLKTGLTVVTTKSNPKTTVITYLTPRNSRTLFMIRRWASIYIKWHFPWDYSHKFRASFIVLSLGDPWFYPVLLDRVGPYGNCQSCFVNWLFEVWEVIAPSVNAEYVAMSMSWLISVKKPHPLTDTANRTAGAVWGRINATYRLSATILPSLYDNWIIRSVIHWRHQGVLSEEFQQTGC